MGNLKRAGRIATILWSLLIGISVIVCAGTVMLPSTKRARIHLRHLEAEPPGTATTAPTSATVPATQP